MPRFHHCGFEMPCGVVVGRFRRDLDAWENPQHPSIGYQPLVDMRIGWTHFILPDCVFTGDEDKPECMLWLFPVRREPWDACSHTTMDIRYSVPLQHQGGQVVALDAGKAGRLLDPANARNALRHYLKLVAAVGLAGSTGIRACFLGVGPPSSHDHISHYVLLMVPCSA